MRHRFNPRIRVNDWNLFPDFFGDMSELTWPGQFNLDFMGFLSLAALWLAWRHEFSPMGLLLGVIGFFGGIGVFGALSFRSQLAIRRR